jgi:hypothetical protein
MRFARAYRGAAFAQLGEGFDSIMDRLGARVVLRDVNGFTEYSLGEVHVYHAIVGGLAVPEVYITVGAGQPYWKKRVKISCAKRCGELTNQGQAFMWMRTAYCLAASKAFETILPSRL